MLKCPVCSGEWGKCGAEYRRKNSNKVDYYCFQCMSKRKPVNILYENEKGRITEYNIEDDKAPDWFTIDQDLKEFSNTSKVPLKIHPTNILLIGDLHLPFTLKNYLDFCTEIYDKYNCDHVIFMGDLIDNHFSSFHATDPDGLSAGDELDFAIKELQKWSKAFPEADVCHGNHDLILLRKAYKEGVSKRWIKDFAEVLGVNWNFQPSFEYNGCLFRHGMNMAASVKSGSEMMNVCQGHFHTKASIDWHVGRGKKVFGMQVPVGVDRESYAMAYAKEFPKQAIGCAVLLENGRLPVIEMMEL